MSNLLSKTVKLKAKEHNIKTKKLLPVGTYVWLLKKIGLSGEYEKLYEVKNFWYEYKNWRRALSVRSATLEEDFKAALNIASDVTIDGDVHEIDKRDIKSPDGIKPYWEFFCNRTDDTYDGT